MSKFQWHRNEEARRIARNGSEFDSEETELMRRRGPLPPTGKRKGRSYDPKETTTVSQRLRRLEKQYARTEALQEKGRRENAEQGIAEIEKKADKLSIARNDTPGWRQERLERIAKKQAKQAKKRKVVVETVRPKKMRSPS